MGNVVELNFIEFGNMSEFDLVLQ